MGNYANTNSFNHIPRTYNHTNNKHNYPNTNSFNNIPRTYNHTNNKHNYANTNSVHWPNNIGQQNFMYYCYVKPSHTDNYTWSSCYINYSFCQNNDDTCETYWRNIDCGRSNDKHRNYQRNNISSRRCPNNLYLSN